MKLNEYQAAAREVSNHGTLDDGFLGYFALALSGEAGEFANFVKKAWRSGRLGPPEYGYHLSAEEHVNMIDELGDILWYLAGSAHLLGTDLETVAERNLVKLQARKESQ